MFKFFFTVFRLRYEGGERLIFNTSPHKYLGEHEETRRNLDTYKDYTDPDPLHL